MLTAIPPSFTQAEAIALTGGEDSAATARLPLSAASLHRPPRAARRRPTTTTGCSANSCSRKRSGGCRPTSGASRARVPPLLMEARGQASEALALFRDADNVEAMRRVIIANALDWARQGRAQTLVRLDRGAAGRRCARPIRGSNTGTVAPGSSCGRRAAARRSSAPTRRFRAAGDLRGQALALNTIVTGYYYEWANFVPLDRWLPEFDRLLGPESAAKLDRESELRARAAHVIALLFRRPEDPELAVSARRLDELIDGGKRPQRAR